MAYGVRYQAEFDSTADQPYTVQILQKDYVGAVSGLMLSGVPVKHRWETDEPKEPIKGSSLTLSLYNDGSLPITTFYSPNDDEFKIRFYWGTAALLSYKMFEGFLVQDDCSELMADYKHEIVLSFNDNLGLLKDIALDENIPDFGYFPAIAYFDFVAPAPDNFIYLYNTNYTPVVSTPFTISGHIDPAANATWTPTAVTQIGSRNWKVQVADLSFTDMVAFPCAIAGASTIDLYNRNTLLNIIRVCLYNTGLELNTYVYANLFEESHSVDYSFLEQTYIDTQTFLSDQKFDDCYKVLTYILDRFNLTLFQAYGRWNIIRWDELRYYPSLKDIPYFIYLPDFTLQSSGNAMDNNFNTGFEQTIYPENGLTRSIFRPFKFDKETFNYKQPKYLLRNYDLQNLGAFITSYTVGGDTYSEYEFTDWNPGGFSPQPDYFIRVVTDTATGDEKERYAVVEGDTGDTARSIVGEPFEVSAGDKIQFDFTFRTTKSQAGPGTVVLAVKLYDGTTTNYADEDKTVNWKTTLGWNYTFASGSNTNTNQSVTIDPGQIPFDGLIYCYLPQATLSGVISTDETHIKDIRVTYTPFINDSIKIIGQVHNSEQSLVIKNNEAIDINIDDAPRNSIAGTLFKSSFTNLIQDRTRNWYRITNPSEELRIGEITTFEQLFWRRNSRTKLEGTFYGLIQDIHISMLAAIKNVAMPDLNFVFGSLEIDYRNNNLNCTQWELCDDTEVDGDLTSDYTFTYLYDTK